MASTVEVMADRTVPATYVGAPLQTISSASTGQVGATGAGTSWDLLGGYSNFTCHIDPSTAGTGTASVAIQGSLDDTNWVNLSAATTSSTAGRTFNSTAGYTVGFLRANVTAIGSTDTELNVYIAARP